MKVWTENGDVLAWLLDAAALRQRVAAGNLANVNTPGYRSKTLRFDHALHEALRAGAPMRSLPAIVEREDARARADGNTVDLERELGELTRAALLYQTYVRFLDHEIAAIRVAVTGRPA